MALKYPSQVPFWQHLCARAETVCRARMVDFHHPCPAIPSLLAWEYWQKEGMDAVQYWDPSEKLLCGFSSSNMN